MSAVLKTKEYENMVFIEYRRKGQMESSEFSIKMNNLVQDTNSKLDILVDVSKLNYVASNEVALFVRLLKSFEGKYSSLRIIANQKIREQIGYMGVSRISKFVMYADRKACKQELKENQHTAKYLEDLLQNGFLKEEDDLNKTRF